MNGTLSISSIYPQSTCCKSFSVVISGYQAGLIHRIPVGNFSPWKREGCESNQIHSHLKKEKEKSNKIIVRVSTELRVCSFASPTSIT